MLHGASVFGHSKFRAPQSNGVTTCSFSFAGERAFSNVTSFSSMLYACHVLQAVALYSCKIWNLNLLAESWSRLRAARPETTSLV